MIVALAVVVVIVLAVYFFMSRPLFGAIAKGERLERIKHSPNYRDGSFQNIHPTSTMTEGVSFFKVLKDFIFNKSERLAPSEKIPSRKTDLFAVPADENILVWFGHSSYYIQVDGKKILVDPVFSGNASPLSFTTKSYPGTDVYTPEDFPAIDYLFISHDHWDHLDYPTILSFKPKIKKLITGLGTAAHFERWGFDKHIIIEKDWNKFIELDPGFTINTLPARHFSGRGFKRSQSLWMSFAFITPAHKIYLGGDSGYDTHFAGIGKTFGPFDLAILECGQYNVNWRNIHMMPEETVQAAIDLGAKKLLPVHWGKFSLAQHAWDEPITRATAEAAKKNMPVIHPMIGEKVNLDDPAPSSCWWEEIR